MKIVPTFDLRLACYRQRAQYFLCEFECGCSVGGNDFIVRNRLFMYKIRRVRVGRVLCQFGKIVCRVFGMIQRAHRRQKPTGIANGA